MSLNQTKYIFVAALAMVATIEAEEAPLPPEKMWEYSDAIVVVDVLSITHTGETGIQDEPVYSVRMRVCEVRKGDLRVGHIMVWQMSNYQPPPGGYGGGIAYPGERLLYYLKRFPNGSYNTWGSSCCETLYEVPAAQRVLPTRPGEKIEILPHCKNSLPQSQSTDLLPLRICNSSTPTK